MGEHTWAHWQSPCLSTPADDEQATAQGTLEAQAGCMAIPLEDQATQDKLSAGDFDFPEGNPANYVIVPAMAADTLT